MQLFLSSKADCSGSCFFCFILLSCFHSRGKCVCKKDGQGCSCQDRAWIWVTFLTPDPLCGFWPRQLVCFGHDTNSLGAPCSQGICGSQGSLNSHAGTWCFQRIQLSVPQEAVAVFLASPVLFQVKIKSCLFSTTWVILDCPWSLWACLVLLRKGSCSSDKAYYAASCFLCSLYKRQPGVLNLIINYKTQWLNAARFIII